MICLSDTEAPIVIQLVTGKATEVRNELEALLEHTAAEGVWLPLWMSHSGDSDDNAGINMDPVLVVGSPQPCTVHALAKHHQQEIYYFTPEVGLL